MTGKLLSILTLSMTVQMVSAQDIIVKKDGSTIVSKVLEVNTDNIKYKKFSNQNGPTYTINLTDVMAVNYENGFFLWKASLRAERNFPNRRA